jgi:protein FRA10AC1
VCTCPTCNLELTYALFILFLFNQFALRWRTEDEVLSGAGETTCGNTRCSHHTADEPMMPPPLSTLELPFAYEEQGETKSALVKVVLCGKCVKKLLWKRQKEKEIPPNDDVDSGGSAEDQMGHIGGRVKEVEHRENGEGPSRRDRHDRRRNSRSRSPRPRHKSDARPRRRSPKS